jgi:hypothetical protein
MKDFRHCPKCNIFLDVLQCGAFVCSKCGEVYAPEDFPQFMELSQDLVDAINHEVFEEGI